jgi:hypothetical protein
MARRCKKFSNKMLFKGAKIEKREHRLSMKTSLRIARDHLCANPRHYSRKR